MKRKLLTIIFIVLIFGYYFSFGQKDEFSAKSEILSSTRDLSVEGKKLADYLLDDWKKRFHSTSIPNAMSNLGMKSNDDLRLEVGQFFRDSTQLAKNLQWWGANNYIFNHDEKLIAKYLINNNDTKKELPGSKELQDEIGITDKDLKNSLAFMEKAGFLQSSDNVELGYTLAESFNRWGGPLRHNFHTVSIDDGSIFDVW